MVDNAMRAHKLGRSQRSWALKYATENSTGFVEVMKHTPDHVADRRLAITELFLENA
jgi:hypothetical protein